MEIKVNVTVNGEVDVKKIAEQIRQQIEKAQKPALKVGDYAKVVNDWNNYNLRGILAGTIVEIIKVEEGADIPYEIKSLVTGATRWAKNDHIETVTEGEVAEAKRWAAIGRKPNEFKKGDAVKYKNAFTTVTESMPGLIRINQSNNVDKNIAVRPADLTLVFPVESRFE